MAWTFKLDELMDSALYQVRVIIGDTEEDDQIMSDEEILFALVEADEDTLRAAIKCCERISAKYAKKTNFKLGPYSVDLSRRAYMYKALAAELRGKLLSDGPIWTGTRPPVFDVGMMGTRSSEEV